MSLVEYSQKLTDNRWMEKRLEIIERDNGRCTHCRSRDNLEVHHLAYILGSDPWQVPDEFLVTLCYTCHKSEEKYKKEIKSVLRSLSISGVSYKKIFNYLSNLKP